MILQAGTIEHPLLLIVRKSNLEDETNATPDDTMEISPVEDNDENNVYLGKIKDLPVKVNQQKGIPLNTKVLKLNICD